MANPEHLTVLEQGVRIWNEWRKDVPEAEPDLSFADLRRANFAQAKFNNANLSSSDLGNVDMSDVSLKGADLSYARLSEANLSSADLSNADLSDARLRCVNLRDADLSSAVMHRTYLLGANFQGTTMCGADTRDAIIGWTAFTRVDLTKVAALETLRHKGPSAIGIEMILTQRLPEAFLRGAGVPESFVPYAGSFLHMPFEFYSCFISYSTQDQEFSDRLYADLQDKGVRCWFAPHDVRSGKKLHEQIDEAIRLYDRLLLILSDHSMNSEWVKTEIAHARQKELNEKRQVLFPITLVPFETVRQWEYFDADIGKSSAREIREYFIPDFSNWKDPDSYHAAFQRLVRDLKAE